NRHRRIFAQYRVPPLTAIDANLRNFSIVREDAQIILRYSTLLLHVGNDQNSSFANNKHSQTL
ncbi:hypothetical protein GBAR_LOCUS11963, partial [Geodia barretti]